MAGKSGIINVKFIADVDKMNKGIAQVNTQLTGFAKVAKYAGIAAAAAFAAKPIVDGIGQSIKAAADLQEAANKVSVVFGTAGNDVLRWAENSVTAFGQSEASALEAAGTFGNLLRSFGETEQKAAEMSTTLVQLSADLASLNNVDIRTVTDSIRSGLSGEQEPLKRLGVTLSDVRLRAEAAALGLKTTGAALDPLVKAQASYSLIMKDTALAQGDFSRTQDSLTNTTRTLQAAIDDAKASIGEGFVIALEEATAAAGGAQGLAGAIEDAGYETGLLIRSLGTAAGALDKLRGKTEDAEEATKDFSDGWLQWIARALGAPYIADGITQMQELEAQTVENEKAALAWDVASRRAAQAQRLLAGNVRTLRMDLDGLELQAYDTAQALTNLKRADQRKQDSFARGYAAQQLREQRAAREELDKFTGSVGSASSATEKLNINLKKTAKEQNAAFELINVRFSKDLVKTNDKVNEAFQARLTSFQASVAEQEQLVETALSSLQSYSDSIVSSVLGNIGLKLKDEAGNALTPQQIVEALFGDISKQTEVVEAVAKNIGTALPPQLTQAILGLAPDAAIALAEYLGNNPEMKERLTNNYKKLAKDTETLLGIPMAEAFAVVGDQSAVSLIDSALATIRSQRTKFKKDVQKSLNTKVYVDVIYRYPSGTPQAPTATAGAQTVRALRAYERSNGTSWRV